MRKQIINAIFIVLIAAFAAGCASQQPPKAPAAVSAAETGVTAGKTAPAFTLTDLAGAAVAAPQPGKVTVLNFWATWCPPCREEMPELDKFARANGAVAFYAVNIQEPAAKVEGYLKQHGFTMPVLLDGGGTVAQAYRVSAIPTTLVIDKAGIIKYRKSGPVTAAELEGVIRGL